MPRVEWALTPMGHCKPKEEYARIIASTNHLEINCFVTGPPLSRLPKPTKSSSNFLYEAERTMYTLRALTGRQGIDRICKLVTARDPIQLLRRFNGGSRRQRRRGGRRFVAEEKKSEMRRRSRLYSQTPCLFWRAA